MSDIFDKLVSDAEDDLIEKNVPVSRVLSRISPSRDDTLVLVVDNIDKARNISEVFIQLKRKGSLSFINYKMMFRIVDLCKSDELSQRLKEYESEFKEYMKRRVSEISMYKRGEFMPGREINPVEGAKLLIITDSSWSPDRSGNEIEDLKIIIAGIFNIMDFGLALERIVPNCLRMYYYVSREVGNMIFPLSLQQQDKLKRRGINEIHYLDYHYICTGKILMKFKIRMRTE